MESTTAGLRIAVEMRARVDDGRWPAGTVLPTDPDPAALDRAHDAVAGMALVTGGDAIPADTDHRLHAAIAGVCRNPDLREQVATLLERASGPVWGETQARAWATGTPLRWTDDHREIVAAPARGDCPGAAAVSRRHLLSAVDSAVGCATLQPSQLRRLHRIRDHLGPC